MKPHFIKIIILTLLVLQASCDIAFKRKSSAENNTHAKINTDIMMTEKEDGSKKSSSKSSFINNNSKIINAYYSNPVNAMIRKDMITHTSISKEQAAKLEVGKIIQHDTQVMPLPLELERILSPLPLHMIRVQVGMHVILMDVKTRKILEIIKI